MSAIPLLRTELTQHDRAAVLGHLGDRRPFVDERLVEKWEGAWADLWQRPAVAFADTGDLLLALKQVCGWCSGDLVMADPLLDPAWREGFAKVWLHIGFCDMDPHSALAVGDMVEIPEGAGALRARLVSHSFGLPAPPSGDAPMLLEEISALPQPLVSGEGDLQLLALNGNRLVATGETTLALARDAALVDALRRARARLPGAAALVLGLARLEALPAVLARRAELAHRYLALHDRGIVVLPPDPPGGRLWERFFLSMRTVAEKSALQTFLARSRIGSGPPIWFAPPDSSHLPGLQRFLAGSLALPLYASLADREQKRIINRLHRWLERSTT